MRISPRGRRDIVERSPLMRSRGDVAVFAVRWQGQSDRPVEHRDENTAHCLCQPSPGCTTSVCCSTRFITQLSARSRRTSHGPRTDCSFRLAIFKSTRSAGANKKRNAVGQRGGWGLSGLHLAIFTPLNQQRGPGRMPVRTSERVEHFAESNTCNERVR